MRSSAADHTRPTPWDLLVAIPILILAVGLWVALLPPAAQAQTSATVKLDGVLLATLSLDGEEISFFPLEEAPYPLTLAYGQGEIWVWSSECPNQDCQKTGPISHPGQQIICLPNRLVVSLVGDSTPSFDAITG